MTRLHSVALLAAAIAVMGGLAQFSTTTAVSAQRSCVVPDVEGKALAAAKEAIKQSHCKVGTIRRVFSQTVPTEDVISQQPHPGARRRVGARVGLLVSKGAPTPAAGAVVARIAVPNSPHGLLALPG